MVSGNGEEKGKEKEEEEVQTFNLQSILRAVFTLDPINKQSSHKGTDRRNNPSSPFAAQPQRPLSFRLTVTNKSLTAGIAEDDGTSKSTSGTVSPGAICKCNRFNAAATKM